MAGLHPFSSSSRGRGGKSCRSNLADTSIASFMGGTRRSVVALRRSRRLGARHALRITELIRAAEERSQCTNRCSRISELIYATCKDVPGHADQVHPDPRGLHRRDHRLTTSVSRSITSPKVRPRRSSSSSLFSLVGIAGSYAVAWFGIRVNTFANSRTAFAALEGQAVPGLRDSAQGGHEHRHAPHLGRARADARASCSSSPATTRVPASSASPSASRWAPRRSASRAASSPRSPTSART